jgi:signal transduction histidine kinase/HAMP domain-containing protein
MTIELRGFQEAFFLELPVRLSGYVVLILDVALLLVLLLTSRRRGAPKPSQAPWGWFTFLILAIAAPLLAQVFLLRLSGTGAAAIPGLPAEARNPSFSLFGAFPWMLAAGLLGVPQAAFIGLLGGAARGGWETYSLLTPLDAALVAAVVARLLRQDYREWPGRLARHPLGSALVGGSILGALRWLELFAHTPGSSFDAFAYALSRVGPTLASGCLEVLVAGVLCEVARSAFSLDWYRPVELTTGPYNRSLSGRLLSVFVSLGLAAGGLLVYGDWVLARAFARQLTEAQMVQTAVQAGDSIPFFIQTGRSLMGGIAQDVAPRLASGEVAATDLEAPLRSIPFFRRLGVFDAAGSALAVFPAFASRTVLPVEVEAGIDVALQGVPEEALTFPQPEGGSAELVFLWPILEPESGQPIGVAAGWVDLVANPMFQPSLNALGSISPSEGFLIDSEGRILAHPDATQIARTFPAAASPAAAPIADTAPDGMPRLVYVHVIEGYPWRVVVTTPLGVVDMLAVRIAVQLIAILGAVGLALVLVVHVGSRRLTRPLRQMAGVAEAMARGSLAQPVRFSGEDEIGRLAASFERMRLGLKARLEEMDLLLNASQRTASSFDLEQVLPPILEGVLRLTGADVVRVTLQGDSQVPSEEPDGHQAGTPPGNWPTLDRQILELCRQRGKFMLVNPSRARAILDVKTLQAPVEALLALPMTSKEGFVGAFWLAHRTAHAFAPDEVNLLSILAGQLGVAVANARLYQRAEEERLRLAAILAATPEGVLVTDGLGRISLANPASEVILKARPEEAVGKPAAGWVTASQVIELLADSGDEVRTAEVEVSGGRVLYAAVADIGPVGPGSAGRVCVLGDITHYKKLDQLKSDFVSTVSHDLRAPLTLMRGYGTMLSMVGDLSDKQQEFARKILDSVDHMARLVDNLLDLGRIEAGVGLNLEKVDVEAVVQEVVESFRPHAVNKQITLQTDLAAGMQPVEADQTLLRQAVANLVDNALKYTPQGGKVNLRAFERDERLVLSVQDNGGGIAPADQVRLFEKFFRARRRESIREKGSGLGLAIVKSIAEQHGGRVSVESRLGVGSTFTLELPLLAQQPAEDALDRSES